MNKIITLFVIFIVIYGIYNTNKRQSRIIHHTTEEKHTMGDNCDNINHLKNELSQLNTTEYAKNYIISVINSGSDTLGFKGGVMEGGIASPEDARMIACYVLTLSNRQCNTPYAKNAPMFYTSLCGGCHGNYGKGLGGNYPDLTGKKLLGIQKRGESLRDSIRRLQK